MPRDATRAARLAGDFRSDYYEIAVQALPDDLSQAFVDDRVATGGVSHPDVFELAVGEPMHDRGHVARP